MKPIDLDRIQENFAIGTRDHYAPAGDYHRAALMVLVDIARSLRKLVESKNENGVAPKDAR